MLLDKYRENKLKKHLESKKITDPKALDLLQKLLDLNPKTRITAEQAYMVSPRPDETHSPPVRNQVLSDVCLLSSL